MSSDDLFKIGPIILAGLSVVISLLGHFLKKEESNTQKETMHIDQIVKINNDLRAELARKQTQLDNSEAENKDLRSQIIRKNEELFNVLVKRHKTEVNQ
jgi:hypothetical protein